MTETRETPSDPYLRRSGLLAFVLRYGGLALVISGGGSLAGLELQMRLGLMALGPLVAVGQPGEQMPIVGVPRFHVGDDWRDRVQELLAEAALVVMRVGASAGLEWEIGEVGRLCPAERIVVIPSPRLKDWQRFVDRFRHPLPEEPGDACLFYFKPDGEAVPLRHPRPSQLDKEWYECHEVWDPVVAQLQAGSGPA